jgi:integrase
MHMRLRGINQVKKRLATGETVTYYYAWKGGPRLKGKPGTPEFIASYNEAIATDRPVKSSETLTSLIDAFQDSDAFISRAERTKADYRKLIGVISANYGDFPLKALGERGTRGEFLAWRDKLAKKSRRQADYAFTVLARILSWGFDRELIDANPCERAGRLYSGSRADKIWSPDDDVAFLAKAPSGLALAFLLAIWTGQRQGDLLRLPWSAYDGETIRLKQGKTGVRVAIKVAAPLKVALDRTKRKGPLILTNSDGRPWTPDSFRHAWGDACDKAEIEGVTFHDLRGTAVTRFFLAGATVPEIAAMTGHSLRAAQDILDKNYFHRDAALAESAVIKADAWAKAAGERKAKKTPN